MKDMITDALVTAIEVDNTLSELSSLRKNAVECVCEVSEPKRDNLIRCPYCGESYYMENYSDFTAVYYPPIYKDGVNINPDRNTMTTHCTCMNCKKDFSYKR